MTGTREPLPLKSVLITDDKMYNICANITLLELKMLNKNRNLILYGITNVGKNHL